MEMYLDEATSWFKPGKLYRSPKLFLYIYPSKEKAIAIGSASWYASVAAQAHRASSAEVSTAEAYWSEQFGFQIHMSRPGDIFMFLERNGVYLHVLFGEKQGWIIFKQFAGLVPAEI